jgi:Peptidoglycan-synthase activator LpoB
MAHSRKALWIMSLLVLVAGCGPDKPQDYADRRPDPGNLVTDDSGLQSKDVLAASDQMAQDLLTSPQLNQSVSQWTLALGHFEDLTTDKSFSTNYDIFIERLRSILSEKGQGRITLIENKENFHAIRNSELEGPDQSDQPAPQAVNPDYIMYGKALDMPNRSTNYFLLQFTIFNSRTRVQVWSRHYEVKVAR